MNDVKSSKKEYTVFQRWGTADAMETMEMFEGTGLAAIGRRLELTRQVLGLQQNEFCGRAKIASNTYNQYERGKKHPSVANALKLCDTYGLTLDWIFRGDPSALRYSMADALKALKEERTSAKTRRSGA